MATSIEDASTEIARSLDAHASWRARGSGGIHILRRYPMGAFGGVISVLLLLIAVAPGLALPLETQDPLRQNVRERLQGPSSSHWFGQDELGRDLYARIIVATRTSMVVGFGVVAIQQLLSIMIGTCSAYIGGKFDLLFQRLIDIGIAIPNLVFIVLLVQTLSARLDGVTLGNGDLMAIVIGIGLVLSAGASRTIRGVALAVCAQTYVEAARATGATGFRVVTRHVVPNVLPIAITSATILVGSAVLIESSLSFLGYGIQPPTPSWGRMLSDGRSQLVRAPHLAIYPGLAIFLTVFSFNMLGDALRDRLDPRLRGSN